MADDTTTLIEYGIEWTAPEDIAGRVTVVGNGRASRERAAEILDLWPRQKGHVVKRLIFWSGWMADDDSEERHA